MWEEYLFPASVEEAVAVLAQRDGRARLIAGGTDLVLEFNEGKRKADCLVDITRIPELKEINLEGDIITVGAAVTFRQLDDSPLIRQRATVLAEAAHTVGSLQIRNVATLGGNVVSALPAADGSLGLTTLGAEAEIADIQGRRWLPLEELFESPGQSKIDASAQVLTALRFKALGSREGSAYERLARRRVLALPILACGTAVGLSEDGRTFQWARVSLGPVAPVCFCAHCTEEFLTGAEVSPETMVRAGEIALSESNPRSSLLRACKEYRQEMIKVLVRRGLELAVAKCQVP
jgi:CO/xanthine dehydrogenase FAD-binding subunit